MPSTTSCVALIPARAGSKRIAGKNIREIGGHPLLAYAIASALDSGVFSGVHVCSDAPDYLDIAQHYGAGRYQRLASEDNEPDYVWLRRAAPLFATDCFAILRPTSPFRTADTIRRAWAQWVNMGERFDSLRAVELCKQHPGKMWWLNGDAITPLWNQSDAVYTATGQPCHSSPTQALPAVYAQNASLEIAWTRVLMEHHNISGERVAAFLTLGREGFDLNTPDDWALMEHLIATGQATLPEVHLGT